MTQLVCGIKWCLALTDGVRPLCPIHTFNPDYRPSDATRLHRLYEEETRTQRNDHG